MQTHSFHSQTPLFQGFPLQVTAPLNLQRSPKEEHWVSSGMEVPVFGTETPSQMLHLSFGEGDKGGDNQRFSHLGEVWPAEFWEYDASLGRRWDIDPIDLPWQSPYVAFDCNPIYFNDPSGLMSAPAPPKSGGGGPKGNGEPKLKGMSKNPAGPKDLTKEDKNPPYKNITISYSSPSKSEFQERAWRMATETPSGTPSSAFSQYFLKELDDPSPASEYINGRLELIPMAKHKFKTDVHIEFIDGQIEGDPKTVGTSTSEIFLGGKWVQITPINVNFVGPNSKTRVKIVIENQETVYDMAITIAHELYLHAYYQIILINYFKSGVFGDKTSSKILEYTDEFEKAPNENPSLSEIFNQKSTITPLRNFNAFYQHQDLKENFNPIEGKANSIFKLAIDDMMMFWYDPKEKYSFKDAYEIHLKAYE